MRTSVRRIPSLIAIYAIAMHTILWGAGPPPASASVDPFSIICHAVAPAGVAGDEAPADPDRAPSHACDHCTLCSAMAPPDALDEVLVGQLAPAALLEVLQPESSLGHSGLALTPKLARGPPAFA